ILQLAQEQLILCMRTDPEPHYSIINLQAQSSPTNTDTDGVNGRAFTDQLELHAGMARIFFP
ncbi:MAG: hypothetical protein WBG50_10610, partial [Desulfomonilaceae bacterium]